MNEAIPEEDGQPADAVKPSQAADRALRGRRRPRQTRNRSSSYATQGSATAQAISWSAVRRPLLFILIPTALGLFLSLLAISANAVDGNALALPAFLCTATPTPTSTPTARQMVDRYLAMADAAWQQEDLAGAVVALEKAKAILPEAAVLDRLFAAHGTLGIRLAEQGRLEEALAHLDLALQLRQDHPVVQKARDMARNYLDGKASFCQGDLDEAVVALEELYTADPNYQDVRALLFEAHYLRGLSFQEAGQLEEARAEYEEAVVLNPGHALAQAHLQQVVWLLTPPTPTPTPTPAKKIIVDVSEQRLRAYENDVLVWDFVCSTGKPGNNTKRGTFAVLDKIPNAWGGTWSIWMPYWMGIYWAGPMENGIHALPINPDGSTLWAGYLGTPISFGCIVLDTWAAKLLYDWAEIGIPVIVKD